MSRLACTFLVALALALTACGEAAPATPCDRAARRVEVASTSTATLPLQPVEGRTRGKLFLSWQGEDGPEVCEPAEAPTCGVAQDGCALPIADVAVGQSSSAELFFIDISPGDVTLYLVDLSYDSCPALSVSDFEAVILPPDAVASVAVTFAPTEVGPCAGVLEVYSDALNVDTGLPTTVTLEASGREP